MEAPKELLIQLTADEKLVVRAFESAELRAKVAAHEFKANAENQFRTLTAQAEAKTAETMAHLQMLAKTYDLDLENTGFDFEKLAFQPKK
jgi:hypothetical protein